MNVSENSPLIPKTTGRDPAVLIECNEISSQSRSGDVWLGITKDELLTSFNDPFWRGTRIILFISFWLLMVAMLISAVILLVKAPRCKNPDIPDETNNTETGFLFHNDVHR